MVKQKHRSRSREPRAARDADAMNDSAADSRLASATTTAASASEWQAQQLELMRETLSAFHGTQRLLGEIYAEVQIHAAVRALTGYALLALLFAALQVALLGINFKSQEFIEEEIFLPFHLAEFWAIFLFTVLEAFLLASSRVAASKTSADSHGASEHLHVHSNGAFQKLYYTMVGLNVMLTFAAAVVLSIDPTAFEVASHFIEYIAQVPIALVNIVFVVQQRFADSRAKSVLKVVGHVHHHHDDDEHDDHDHQREQQRARSHMHTHTHTLTVTHTHTHTHAHNEHADETEQVLDKRRSANACAASGNDGINCELDDDECSTATVRSALGGVAGVLSIITFVASILQLLAYSGAFHATIPAEQIAHFFEFPIEFMNSLFALWFALRTRDALLKQCCATKMI